MAASPAHRAVVAICGGSGSGKSGMASLMAYYLRQAGVGTYVLSGTTIPGGFRRRMTRSGSGCSAAEVSGDC